MTKDQRQKRLLTVTDWKGVTDKSGNETPFSDEVREQLFAKHPYLADDLIKSQMKGLGSRINY